MFGFSKEDVEFRFDVPFSTLSPIRLGGICQTLAYPKNDDAFVRLLSYADKRGLDYRVVDCLSNTLPPDGVYHKLLISTRKMRHFTFFENTVKVSAGVRPLSVAKAGQEHGLSALTELASIPGTVGAGVRGNAGAFGYAFGDFFVSATLYDPDTRSCFSVKKDEMNFSYRHSVLRERSFVLINATFSVQQTKRETVLSLLSENLKKRKATQPFDEASLGSVFLRKSATESASFDIDNAGCKGKTIGGAAVSTKHAGFIINQNSATANDYKELIVWIQKEVKAKFGWVPKCEIDFL